MTRVGVVGGGGFGRGLAYAAARVGRDVLLYSRAGISIEHPKVEVTGHIGDLEECELVFVAVPSKYVAEVAREMSAHLDGRHLLVHVSRGLVGDELVPLTEVLRTHTPCRRVGALAGPLAATAMREGTPSGAVVGTRFPEVAREVRAALASPSMLVYRTDDVVGVEVASAFVGVLALATGFGHAAGLGPAAVSLLNTRGMYEGARVGESLGASRATFGGLAGMGDLLSVVGGDDRPEYRLGRALVRTGSLDAAIAEAEAHVESVTLVRRIVAHCTRVGIHAPICDAIARVLDGRATPETAASALMALRVERE